jgi:hypothetical protein
VAPEIAVPLELVTVPVIVPVVTTAARVKFSVVVVLAVTVALRVELWNPVALAVTLTLPTGTFGSVYVPFAAVVAEPPL